MSCSAYKMDGIKNIYIANFDDVVSVSGKENISTITLKDGAKFKKYSETGDNSDSNNNE